MVDSVDVAMERPAVAAPARSRFYLWLTLAISFTCFYGFWLTYFSPVMTTDLAARLSPTVHLHGWSFFVWFLLLPLQAGLVAGRRVNVHRTLGMASLALAAVMVVTGFIVVAVQIAGGSEFWFANGPFVFVALVLFTAFYSLALVNRTKPKIHKRYIVLASAAVLGAATFRVLLRSPVPIPYTLWIGGMLSNLFIVAAMIHDKRAKGAVHPVYVRGLVASVAVELASIGLVFTPLSGPIHAVIGGVGRLLEVFYL